MNRNRHGYRNRDTWVFQAGEEGGKTFRKIMKGQGAGRKHARLHQPLAACFFFRGGRLVRINLFRNDSVNNRNYRDADEKREHHRPGSCLLSAKGIRQLLEARRQDLHERDIKHDASRKT